MRRRRTAHRLHEKHRTADVMIEEKVDFSGLMLSSDVLEGLKSAGFERPSPIQLKAIPLGRCGLDLIAQAKSGTGKTCVFSVIALENVNLSVLSIQVLVLAPTREIAVQIKDVMCSIGVHMKGLHTNVFIGGIPLEDDKARLKQCHIAIGTPGRIKHLIETKLLQTTSIRLFILDEADKLLEENFQDQINWIYSTLPSSKQMLALSATYPDHLAEQLKNYMKEPTFVRLNAADPALEGIRHYHCVVPFHSLPHKVFHEKVQSLLQLLSKLSFHQCLIFSNYQIRAKSLSETLAKNGWPSTYISGNQGQNERLSAMAKLKEFKCRILISTDLTSRGIDAERVNLVINMDLPHDSETYLHRVGRAGRFGSYGVTVNFVAEGKEVTSLNEIEANCGVTITPLPGDVSKLLSDEMMHASLQNSLPKHQVSLLNIREDMVCKTDHKIINNQNDEHVEKKNCDVGNLESDCAETENKGEDSKVNGMIRVESQLTNNEKDVDMTVGHNQAEQKEDMSIENTKEETKFPNEKILMKNSRQERDGQQASIVKDSEREHKEISTVDADQPSEVIKETFLAENQHEDKGMEHGEKERVCLQGDGAIHTDVGNKNEETKNKAKDADNVLEISDLQSEHEVTSNKHADRIITSVNQKIIFHNHEADLFSGAEQLNSEDCVSDEYESELPSSEETGSTVESTDSYVSSSDSHVPISCKDFDNVLDSYLKGGSCIGGNDLESESRSLRLFLTSKRAEDTDSGIPPGAFNDGIYSNDARSSKGKYANKSPMLKDADDGRATEAQGGVISRASPTTRNPKPQGHGIYANEPSRKFSAEANNSLNSEETMFYGATSDDVTAYMAALPTEWTNTWYRVYERQTNFIMKYTKFCQDNF